MMTPPRVFPSPLSLSLSSAFTHPSPVTPTHTVPGCSYFNPAQCPTGFVRDPNVKCGASPYPPCGPNVCCKTGCAAWGATNQCLPGSHVDTTKPCTGANCNINTCCTQVLYCTYY